MPHQALPWVIAVILYFTTFLTVLGGVALWTQLPTRRPASRTAQTPGGAQRI